MGSIGRGGGLILERILFRLTRRLFFQRFLLLSVHPAVAEHNLINAIGGRGTRARPNLSRRTRAICSG
jgi:hypothetical protein